MSMFDKRADWALPGSECWVVDDGGEWVKGRVISFAGRGYLIMIEGEDSHTAKKSEFEIRPRDLQNYNKDKPEPLGTIGQDRRA